MRKGKTLKVGDNEKRRRQGAEGGGIRINVEVITHQVERSPLISINCHLLPRLPPNTHSFRGGHRSRAR